ncbi:MAG: TolC family protein [Planctomycetes bacterium]|nr:TolC family protein [Planctomycetota bacterium]
MSRRTSPVLLLAAALLGACAPAREVEPWAPPPAPRVTAAAVEVAAVVSRGGPLRLDEVLASADLHHPTVLAALAEQEVALGRLLAAEGAFDLGLRGGAAWDGRGHYDYHWANLVAEQRTTLWGASVFGGYQVGRGRFFPSDSRRATGSEGELVGGVRLPLLQGGAIDPFRAGVAQAEHDIEAAGAGAQAQRIEVSRRAAHAYWACAAASRRLDVARALLRVAEARADAVGEAVERGDVAAIERDENERQVAVRRAFVALATRGVEQAALVLSLFLRDARGRPVRVDPAWLPRDLPEPDAAPEDDALPLAIDRALARRPEPARLEALMRRVDVDRELARNQGLPALDLTARVEQGLGDDTPFGERRLEVTGGLEFWFPIQRRAARGREAAARAQRDALERQAQLVREQIAVDVRDAASAMHAARARHQEALRAEALARRLEQAERDAFTLGQSTLLLVNVREQATAESQVLVLEAAADYQRALADWRAAQGEVGP